MNSNILHFVFIALAVVVAFLFITWQEKQKPWFSLCLKGFASLAFCILGIFGMFLSGSLFLPAILIICGLIASILGDLFLAGINFDNLNKHNTIKSGMIAFTIAQIFYYTALMLWTGFTIWAVVIAVIFAIVSILLEKPLKLRFGKTKPFTFVYALFLALTVTQSVFSAISLEFSIAGSLLMLGFVLFLASDLVLEIIYFKENSNVHSLTYVNLVLYYLAQILIATSIFYI